MANRSMNTHRREMRPVTPVGRIGRNAAGAAITAGLLVGGAGVALADNDAAPAAPGTGNVAAPAAPAAEGAAQAAPAALDVAPAAPVPAAAKPVAIPAGAVKQSADAFGDLDSAAISTQVAKKVEESKPEAPAADDSSDDDAKASSDSSSKSEKKSDKKSEKKQRSEKKRSSSRDEDSAPSAPVAGHSIVSTARNGIGVRYVWGGSTRNGWDCSGFTAWVYRQHGINLPHSAAAQRSMGHRISRSEARPGDLVYTPGHIGIYAGNGRIIDAGTSVRRTSERQMWSASWTFVRIGR